jgi:glyceraldehyde 3-phosphate dehydrogenase
MSVKVAINGFGRIGRLAFRQMFGAEGYEVVAINDLTSPKMLAHLLKYDSSQGRYVNFGEEDQVTADDEAGTITVKGKTIKIYKEPDANNCPWGELDVDVVLECSGFYTSKAKAQAHMLRRLLFQLQLVTILRQSFTMLTMKHLQQRIISFQLLLVQQTA